MRKNPLFFMKKLVIQAITDIKNGKMIIVTDATDRENEGDLIMAAELVTPDAINFMATYGRGLICAPLPPDYAERLELPLMVPNNTSLHHTNFTVSIDAEAGMTTGIPARERAYTINLLAQKNTKPADFLRPGHIFPLIAHSRGLRGRHGHTEAAVELAKLAGLAPVGVLCEILNEIGDSCRGEELTRFAQKHQLTLVSIEDIRQFI